MTAINERKMDVPVRFSIAIGQECPIYCQPICRERAVDPTQIATKTIQQALQYD